MSPVVTPDFDRAEGPRRKVNGKCGKLRIKVIMGRITRRTGCAAVVTALLWIALVAVSPLALSTKTAAAPAASLGDSLDWWNLRYDPPWQSSPDLFAVGYGAGLFVAVGENGAVVTSPDGITWTRRTSPTTYYLRGVAFNDDTVVAVGGMGTILVAHDASSWSVVESGTERSLYGVTSGAGIFVAVGEAGAIVRSIDGDTWSAVSPVTPRYLRGVVCGNDCFAAVGEAGTILVSTDGATWEPRSSGTDANLFGIAYSGSRFVAVGADGVLVVSDDCTNWAPVPFDGSHYNLRNVSCGAGICLAVGEHETILASSDGLTWVRRHWSNTDFTYLAATFGADTFVIAGEGALIYQSNPLGPYSCTWRLGSDSLAFRSSGGSANVEVRTVWGGCGPPSVQPDKPWISGAYSKPYTGKGKVRLRVERNISSLTRQGTVAIGDKALAVVQAGTTCAAPIVKPTNQAVSPQGGFYKATVSVKPADCTWSASASSPWIQVPAGPFTGTGTFEYSVDLNDTGERRKAAITIAVQGTGGGARKLSITQEK
jgi:hypothetical protein